MQIFSKVYDAQKIRIKEAKRLKLVTNFISQRQYYFIWYIATQEIEGKHF